MPETSGPPIPIDPSSTVDKLKVAQWLDSHWHAGATKSCNVCGEIKWAVSEDFAYIGTLGTGGAIQLGGKHFPLVVLTCVNCGQTILFNAIVMGLVAAQRKPETPAA